MLIALFVPELQGRRVAVGDADARGRQLVGARIEERGRRERRDDSLARPQSGEDRRPIRLELAPIAALKPEKSEKPAYVFAVRIELQEALAILSGVLEALHHHQRADAVVERLGA